MLFAKTITNTDRLLQAMKIKPSEANRKLVGGLIKM